MIPILYESSETEFVTNGLGRLRDCISCKVTEERNGIYECEFEYPVSGRNFNKIRHGRIIAATHDGSGDVQPFDIVDSTRPIEGVVTFRAVHVSYRQTKLVTYGENINSLADAFAKLVDVCTPANPFTYVTDMTSTGLCKAFDGVPKTVRAMLGGPKGSILDAYGGEYEFDKFIVKLHKQRGSDKHITIRYGVNLVDYSDETDYTDAFTECIPYYSDGESTVVMPTPAQSGAAGYNGRRECVPLDVTDMFESAPLYTDIFRAAIDYMKNNEVYMPRQTINVDFVRLQDSEEYAQYAKIMDCRLCDTIRIIFPQYNMDGRMKIVKSVYDVLMERYESMELGSLSTTLAEALGIG